jgi:WD40 repeat protein
MSNDNDGIASNGIFTAVPWKGNSTFALFANNDYKKFDQTQPLVKGHKGNISDVQFYPFSNQILASSSADTFIKIWVCPKGGLKKDLMESQLTLKGHSKNVTNINWHKIAENTLASGSMDSTVRVWDVENQKATMMYSDPTDQTVCLRWSPDGARLCNMQKNKEM